MGEQAIMHKNFIEVHVGLKAVEILISSIRKKLIKAWEIKIYS
jgi:hypothetical protein